MSKSFTLVELIIYIALVALVAIVAVSFAWNIINARIKNQAYQEAQQNLRFGLEKITQAIRGADDASISDSVLTLNYPTKDIILDVAAKTINLGGQDVEIHKLRITDGPSDPEALTSDKVDVTNFILTNLTQGSEPKNIKIELTIKYVNPSQDPKWEAEISSETASSVRISP